MAWLVSELAVNIFIVMSFIDRCSNGIFQNRPRNQAPELGAYSYQRGRAEDRNVEERDGY